MNTDKKNKKQNPYLCSSVVPNFVFRFRVVVKYVVDFVENSG